MRLKPIASRLADVASTVAWVVKLFAWIVLSGWIVSGWAAAGVPALSRGPARPRLARWHRQSEVLLAEIERALSTSDTVRDQGRSR
jgi:hypothetical protein